MEQVVINRGAKRHFENLDALRFPRRTLRIWPLYFAIVFSRYAAAWFCSNFTLGFAVLRLTRLRKPHPWTIRGGPEFRRCGWPPQAARKPPGVPAQMRPGQTTPKE